MDMTELYRDYTRVYTRERARARVVPPLSRLSSSRESRHRADHAMFNTPVMEYSFTERDSRESIAGSACPLRSNRKTRASLRSGDSPKIRDLAKICPRWYSSSYSFPCA